MNSISLLPFSGFDQLANLSLHQVAFQPADVTDVELAIQMIGFVEERAGQQVFAGLLVPLAMRILGTNRDLLGARYRLPKFRNAETSFRLSMLPFLMKNLRIRQHKFGVRIFLESDIDHSQSLGDAYLGRSQTDSMSFIHGLEHVVDQLSQFVVENRHRLTGPLQYRVAKFYDGIDHSVVLQLLAVALKITQRFGHGVAAKLLECAAGQCKSHHGLAGNARGGDNAYIRAFVGCFHRLTGGEIHRLEGTA